MRHAPSCAVTSRSGFDSSEVTWTAARRFIASSSRTSLDSVIVVCSLFHTLMNRKRALENEHRDTVGVEVTIGLTHVTLITIEQLIEMIANDEKFKLVDVLPGASYRDGQPLDE